MDVKHQVYLLTQLSFSRYIVILSVRSEGTPVARPESYAHVYPDLHLSPSFAELCIPNSVIGLKNVLLFQLHSYFCGSFTTFSFNYFFMHV